MKRHRYHVLWLACCWLLYLLPGMASAAATPRQLEHITLQLKWKHQFQFAGYYAAQAKGFFRDEGLDVTLKPGGPDIAPLKEVLEGRAQYAIDAGELVYYRLQGKPVVALASIFQHSPAMLMTRQDSGFRTPHDLAHKRVGLTVGGQPVVEVAAMFVNEGVKLDALDLRPNAVGLDALIKGDLDADFGYMTNEPFLSQQSGHPMYFIQPVNYGVDFYGDTLFTSERQLDEHPEQVAALRRAVVRGWRYALENPDEIIRSLVDAHPKLHRDALRFEASHIHELIKPEIVEIGHMNPERWRRMADTFVKLGMISDTSELAGFLYDPEQKPDYQWVWWVLGILGSAILLGFAGIGGMSWINGRLQEKNTQLQQARDKAEAATRAKSIFLANISHEIRTPLTAVTGLSQLLQQSGLQGSQREYVEKLYSSSRLLLGIVDDVMDFSCIEAGELVLRPVPFDLQGILQSVRHIVQEVIQTKELAFTFKVDEDVPSMLVGDPLRLNQVLNNLLVNAVKFTRKGSVSLHVSLETRTGDNVRVQFSVRDTGVGIPAGQRDSLFEPFVRMDTGEDDTVKGVGLGLSISRRLVERMGGTIRVESIPGIGSEFSFCADFGVAPDAATPAPAGKPKGNVASLAGAHILLVDDEPLNRMIGQELLNILGCVTECAADANEARAALERADFHIVLMDIELPGMRGDALTRQLRQDSRWQNLPVIALTAHATDEVRDAALAAGMDDYLTKPFDVDQLRAILLKWLVGDVGEVQASGENR